MTANVASSTPIVCGAPAEHSDASVTRVYRIRKSFAAVHFDPAGKGRIVFLPEGAELRVIGSSCLCECFEVLCENRHYNIFKVDLLGPWSSRIEPIRAMAAARACA
jgi:hypothetical protein